jgi:peptidoglycan/xylan/chitin deacetylase (PgdA/CDA1 family)
MNWKQVRGWLAAGQRQVGPRHMGAVFSLGLALALGLFARQSMPGPSDVTAYTPIPAYEGLAPSTETPLPSLTPLPSPSPEPTLTPTSEPMPTAAAPPTEVAPDPTALAEPTLEPTPLPTPEPTATPRPLPTPDGVIRTVQVPILMYHYISAPPPDAGAVRRDLSISPAQFEAHLRYLQDQGYTTVSLEEVVMALQVGQPLPDRPIVLTFDDGYRDHYDHAFPLLQQYGMTGTFFLITSVIDQGHAGYVTWDQVIEMDAAGMSMQPHGYTHDDLKGRSRDYLIWQMLGSKEAIEARTGKPVRFFCYPAGRYDAQGINVLRELDYWAAVTTHFGAEHRSDDLFELKRLRIHGHYGAEHLAGILPEPPPSPSAAP